MGIGAAALSADPLPGPTLASAANGLNHVNWLAAAKAGLIIGGIAFLTLFGLNKLFKSI